MQTFIIHVKTAIEREVHIKNQLKNTNNKIDFILEGDIPDLYPDLLEVYFKGNMNGAPNGAISCAYKHLRAYQRMLDNHIPIALILEDDIILEKNFYEIVDGILKEVELRSLNCFAISIEDSNVRYINKSERKEGTYLYPKNKGRLTGAYIVDYDFAKSVIDYTLIHKCDVPIDWYHNICCQNGVFQFYWSHPTVAYQASISGKFKSLIDHKPKGFVRELSYLMQRSYKKILYYFR